MTSATYRTAFVDIIAAPGTLFEGLKDARAISWVALILLIGISSACIITFFNGMSTEWLVEQQMLQLTDESEADRQAIREYLTENADTVGTLGAVFNGIFLLIMVAVLAGYFKLVGHRQSDITFGDWFSFAVWTQFPIVVQMLGFAALMVTASTGDLPMTMLNYASANQLAFGLSIDHVYFQLLETLSAFYLWSIVLGATGLQRWVGFSTGKAYALSAMPYVLFFGLWAVFAG